MATLREYYETGFSHCAKVHIKVPMDEVNIEGVLLYDFAGFFAFLSIYVPRSNNDLEFFIKLLSHFISVQNRFLKLKRVHTIR